MNSIKIIKLVLLTFLATLIAGCGNSKVSHYNDGGNLLCTDSNMFSKDTTRYVNKDNSSYDKGIKGPRTRPEGFNQSGAFFDIDDCKIK